MAKVKSADKESSFLQTAQADLTNMWTDLFTEKRGGGCKSGSLDTNTVTAAPTLTTLNLPNVRQARKADDSWIKKWGYGEAAYLFDFLDPVFQNEMVSAFKKLYKEASAVSNKDTDSFSDPFDLTKILQNKKTPVDLKTVNKNYNQTIYDSAINAVQFNDVIKKWNWFINPGDSEYAINFISRFDLDGDGRINPRELVLGAIVNNKDSYTTSTCENCFLDIVFKLDAMFIYLDCNSDGFLSAEDLWNSLPKLNRPVNKYNIFSVKNSDNIRTSAVNDFVIKSSQSKEGSLTKEEFRNGILLGYWDRQTKETAIVEDDSRNLKALRWTNGGMTDTVAFNYMKEKELSEMIAKA